MYPNPTNGILTIETEENFYGLDIFNIAGQKVKSQTYNTYDIASVDLSDIKPGIYTVSLAFKDNKISIQKLIIQ